MRIRLLGTGSADGVPGYFGDTRVSEYAREHRGREVRTRSAAVVDDCLKIDFGPDSLAQIQREGLDTRDWCALLFTHSHDDHFCPSELQYLLYPFCDCEVMPFPIYGNAAILDAIRSRYPDWPFELNLTESFKPFSIGAYEITPIHAHHMLEEDAHNFVIEHAGSKLIYATDTGVWLEDTWAFLPGLRADALVIECGQGAVETDYYGHLTFDQVLEVVDRMRAIGAVHADTQIVTTHHSQLGDQTYAELVELLAPHGIEAGYDGMVLEI